MPPASPTTVTRYHLRVELDEITPPIWRRFWIDGDRSQVREFMEWLGVFDPERFDVVAVDTSLRREAWNRVGKSKV